MSANSKIEWTDHTFNPWIGCTKVSPGCVHCYAEQRDRRHLIEKVDHWGKGAPRLRTSESNWRQPILWNDHAVCEGCGEFVKYGTFHVHVGVSRFRRPRVFCASLADIFDDEVPIEWLADLLALIHATPNLDWLLLTKRPENFFSRLNAVVRLNNRGRLKWDHISPWVVGRNVPLNVWIGTSVEDQKRADARIEQLLQIPAKIRFLSCEPLLGAVDVAKWLVPDECGCGGYDPAFRECVHWVIVGGESGHGARPMHPDWARSLRDQCLAAGVPFFFKQWGEFLHERVIQAALEAGEEDGLLKLFQHPHVTIGNENFFRVGKKEAGRGLDGQDWSQFPQLVTGHSSLVTAP